jgi:hypothetical protein
VLEGGRWLGCGEIAVLGQSVVVVVVVVVVVDVDVDVDVVVAAAAAAAAADDDDDRNVVLAALLLPEVAADTKVCSFPLLAAVSEGADSFGMVVG